MRELRETDGRTEARQETSRTPPRGRGPTSFQKTTMQARMISGRSTTVGVRGLRRPGHGLTYGTGSPYSTLIHGERPDLAARASEMARNSYATAALRGAAGARAGDDRRHRPRGPRAAWVPFGPRCGGSSALWRLRRRHRGPDPATAGHRDHVALAGREPPRAARRLSPRRAPGVGALRGRRRAAGPEPRTAIFDHIDGISAARGPAGRAAAEGGPASGGLARLLARDDVAPSARPRAAADGRARPRCPRSWSTANDEPDADASPRLSGGAIAAGRPGDRPCPIRRTRPAPRLVAPTACPRRSVPRRAERAVRARARTPSFSTAASAAAARGRAPAPLLHAGDGALAGPPPPAPAPL